MYSVTSSVNKKGLKKCVDKLCTFPLMHTSGPVKLFIITNVTSILRSLGKVILNTSHFLDYIMHALHFTGFFLFVFLWVGGNQSIKILCLWYVCITSTL